MEALTVTRTPRHLPCLILSTNNVQSSKFVPIKGLRRRRRQALRRRCSSKEEPPLMEGLPKEFYDDVMGLLRLELSPWLKVFAVVREELFLEKHGPFVPVGKARADNMEWQARQREKTKEFNMMKQEEDEEDERKVQEYREIGMRLMDFPQEHVMKARKLVASFIRSAEEVEEKIEAAAEKGELSELVLMVIWNRLDLARRDDEKDAIRSLDLLYRRVETEILKREASPAMRLLNDLLNMYDGFDNEGWLKECRKLMISTFPREDPLSILVPAGFDLEKQEGLIRPSLEADDLLLRVDFVREVDALLQEVRAEQNELLDVQGFDPESVATRLKQQEKQRTIQQVESLLELTINLQW